tara:strand:+ start:2026 stop:2226 length:201 start_codon:yes stop_codon:yes gene_type:complete
MPIYDYTCAHCSHTYEAMRKSFSSRPPRKCPSCGESGSQKKQFSSTGISVHFKGPGFFVNDYPKDK